MREDLANLRPRRQAVKLNPTSEPKHPSLESVKRRTVLPLLERFKARVGHPRRRRSDACDG